MFRYDIVGIKDVAQRKYITGSAIFEIHFAGSSEQLAETLSISKNNDLRLQVQGVSSNRLDTQLVEVKKKSSVAINPPKLTAKAIPIIIAKKDVINPTRTPESINTEIQPPTNQIDTGNTLKNTQKIKF